MDQPPVPAQPGPVPPPMNWQPPPAAGDPRQPGPDGGTGAVVAAAFLGVWVVMATVGGQSGVWLIDQLVQALGSGIPGWVWPVASLVDAVLVGLPALLLATVPRSPAVRAAGRAWLVGAVALGALGALRGIPLAHHEAYLAALGVLGTLGAVVLRRLNRRSSAPAVTGPAGSTAQAATADATAAGATNSGTAHSGPTASPPTVSASANSGTALGLATGSLVLLPWLWVGAAGGVTETVLAVLAAAACGFLAAETLSDRFWAPYQTAGTARLVLLGGSVAGVALTLIGAGIGAVGSQLAMLFMMPTLGFAAAASRNVGGRAATMAMVAMVALGPLALVDPEEISLLLVTGRDVPFWTLAATAGSVLIALLAALLLALVIRPSLPRMAAILTAGVTVLAAAGIYLGLGQPGSHGEHLFVIMRDQASLAELPPAPAGLTGHGQRVRTVYERLVRHAEDSQADIRRDLDRWNLSYTPYYLVNALEVDAGPMVRAWLERRDDVDRVLLAQQARPLPARPSTRRGDAPAPSGAQWNITMLQANRVWSEFGVTGGGIVVGTSDSGVDGRHPALSDGFRGGDDSWYDPWNGSRAPQDHGGHGTHTLGSAVGNGGIGVAPDAKWVGCVNLDRNLGNPARYLDCLQFMLAPFPPGGDPFTDGRPDRAPHVLTNSWGCTRLEGCDPGALRPATAAFARAGILFVAAAGNTGPRCDSIDDPPAPYADVLTVGAVNQDRRVTLFSSRGPADDGQAKPDVLAPGASVLSALPGGGYGELDGTSMAAPQVAGVVALLWSAEPTLVGDLERTRELLRSTAVPVLVAGQDACGDPRHVVGAGVVDAHAAIQSARSTRGR